MTDRRELTAIESGLAMRVRELEAQRDGLLRACEAVVAYWDDPSKTYLAGSVMDGIRAAIVKAREGK